MKLPKRLARYTLATALKAMDEGRITRRDFDRVSLAHNERVDAQIRVTHQIRRDMDAAEAYRLRTEDES